MAETSRPRAPRQSRGQARIDLVLDAAATLVAAQGVGAITMHALAKRTGTSIGSMYHFFPDRESVLKGLRDRHVKAMQAITQQLLQTPAQQWQAPSMYEVMRDMCAPYLTYLSAHADYLPLMHSVNWADDDGAFREVIEHMLAARLPHIAPSRRSGYAAMLHAAAAGTIHVGYGLSPTGVDLYLREIPGMLGAYLKDIEIRHQTAVVAQDRPTPGQEQRNAETP